jgi:hypothetical protein
MSIRTKYIITQSDFQAIKSFPSLSEIPYFLKDHRKRLKQIENMVIVVSNKRHYKPSYILINAFHRHRTPYGAVDALAVPLAKYFMQSEILPIINPIFSLYYEKFEAYYPKLNRIFMERGILIEVTNWRNA